MTVDATGPALRLLRQHRGMTQQQVAERAGVTKAMISSYERSKRSPRIHTVCRIVEAMGFTLVTFGRAMDRVIAQQQRQDPQ